MVLALHFADKSVPLDLANEFIVLLDECVYSVVKIQIWILIFYFSTSPRWQMVACFFAALTYWLAIVFTLRYSLKLLLMYKGWMYEARGKGSTVSLPTRLWFIFVRIFSGWNTPRLYSFQGSLPRLPLPSLRSTMQRVSFLFNNLFFLSKHFCYL